MSYIVPEKTYASLFVKEKPLKGFNLLNKFNHEHQTPFNEKSYRLDVKYENYKGHKLDRKMLDILLKYK